MIRDFRFDELLGIFNQEKFEKVYFFLDEVKVNEKKVRILINYRYYMYVMINIIYSIEDYVVFQEVERLLNKEY